MNHFFFFLKKKHPLKNTIRGVAKELFSSSCQQKQNLPTVVRKLHRSQPNHMKYHFSPLNACFRSDVYKLY